MRRSHVSRSMARSHDSARLKRQRRGGAGCFDASAYGEARYKLAGHVAARCACRANSEGTLMSTTDSLPVVTLGKSELRVPPICLGTMTFGEQVDEPTSHAILDKALERGVNFIDTAEMYPVPVRRETYGASERIIGNWFACRPGMRDQVVLATKVAGPSRNADWIRNGSSNLTAAEI